MGYIDRSDSDSAHKHAVTGTSNGNIYSYDQNGNQTSRRVGGTTYTLIYDAENRLVQVKLGRTIQATYTYNGDGNRVKTVVGSTTTAFVGNILEWTGSTTMMKKYYYAGGQRVAMRQGSSTLYYLLTDHLGSTSITATSGGGFYTELRYYPWGGTRYASGTTPTSFRYTGQREAEVGLYYYGARFYDPALGRFVQADSIIPHPGIPSSFDRYAYVRNNPIRRIDPSGHLDCDDPHVAPGDCVPSTPPPQPPNFINPWGSEPPWERLGIEPEIWLRQNNMSMDDIFLGGLVDPLHAGNYTNVYGGFGGCNTLTGSCANGHHAAVDAGGSSGQAIYSAGYGVVVYVGYMADGFGIYIIIQHEVYGVIYYTVYAHLESASVAIGDIVDYRTLIGGMGTTGGGNSVHLHFEARTSAGIDFNQIDPWRGHPFTGAGNSTRISGDNFWPYSHIELSTFWVDLTPLLWVDYDPGYFDGCWDEPGIVCQP